MNKKWQITDRLQEIMLEQQNENFTQLFRWPCLSKCVSKLHRQCESLLRSSRGQHRPRCFIKNYDSDEAAIADMKNYQVATNNALSVGLGAGDPNQSGLRISAVLQPQHVNQVFTGAGTSRALLGQSETIVNALVSQREKSYGQYCDWSIEFTNSICRSPSWNSDRFIKRHGR